MNSHLTLCWSVKGGQGVTVTTALLALAIQHHGIGVDVIDHTGGDLAAALAVPPFDRRANTLQQAINEAVAVTERVRLLTLDADDPRVQLALLAHLEQADQERRHVVIDGGQTTAWARGGTLEHLARIAARSYLVIRPCYLAVRRAVAVTPRPTGLIVLSEPGRALRRSDIESALGLPVAAELTIDPAVARAVDAGLLTTRLPAGAAGDLRHLAWLCA